MSLFFIYTYMYVYMYMHFLQLSARIFNFQRQAYFQFGSHLLVFNQTFHYIKQMSTFSTGMFIAILNNLFNILSTQVVPVRLIFSLIVEVHLDSQRCPFQTLHLPLLLSSVVHKLEQILGCRFPIIAVIDVYGKEKAQDLSLSEALQNHSILMYLFAKKTTRKMCLRVIWRLGGHYILYKLWFNIQRVQDCDHSPTQ